MAILETGLEMSGSMESFEGGGPKVRDAGADEVLDRIMGIPSEHFVKLDFRCMDSSYSSES